ncbi:glycosyltransferase family 2 protein [Brevundimonas subvibrioides]|uniref:Glycosyl transferase family 2 n=1 Tax=Brevundimonas subvibrioides (strain ATCC 15264 / DSM 4735 / LMG 14903 / NBRC 16000 / CB 81) TaxID=633149 RepID=D9QNG2_BRESC|nr:glycosyltransferase [Brevundimonas subvibrioides]ADL02197.1 glycosyl transferase family 2 [Brevundimonas subvibrioides ATCC 15264]
MSDVSALTLVKNRDRHLHRLVEGLQRSAVLPRELVIVDMSDTPVALHGTAFPIRIVRLETGALPLARARNLAAAEATGDHLLFLDVDCIPAAGLVQRIDDELRRADVLVCAEVRYLAEDAVDDGWTEAGLAALAAPHPVRPFPMKGRRIEPNAGLFWSLTFGIRRETFRRVGGFDETFTGYGAEDTDFGFRCRDAGLPLAFAGGGPGSFHQHHGVYDPPLQHFEDIVRNATRFQARWGVWAMEGWLEAFDRLELVAFDGRTLTRRRPPTPDEIEAAHRPPDVRY